MHLVEVCKKKDTFLDTERTVGGGPEDAHTLLFLYFSDSSYSYAGVHPIFSAVFAFFSQKHAPTVMFSRKNQFFRSRTVALVSKLDHVTENESTTTCYRSTKFLESFLKEKQSVDDASLCDTRNKRKLIDTDKD